MKNPPVVSYDTPDTSVPHSMELSYPSAQCRFDTIVAGALCKKSKRTKHLNFSFALPTAEACSEATPREKQGARPACWYIPPNRKTGVSYIDTNLRFQATDSVPAFPYMFFIVRALPITEFFIETQASLKNEMPFEGLIYDVVAPNGETFQLSELKQIERRKVKYFDEVFEVNAGRYILNLKDDARLKNVSPIGIWTVAPRYLESGKVRNFFTTEFGIK